MIRIISIISGKRSATVNYREGWQGILESEQYAIGSPS